MAEHTPTPWKVTVDGRAGEIIRAADSTGRPIASMWINGDDMAANAALIVRAVNSHDALVKALRKLVKAVNFRDAVVLDADESPMRLHDAIIDIEHGMGLARAALSALGEQNGGGGGRE